MRQLLLLFLLFLCTHKAYGADLIALVAANTLPRENNVGREFDVMKIVNEMEMIAQNTGLNLDLTLFIHEEFDSKLIDKLDTLSVNPDDVIFFYYSGHGYREENKKNPWPNIHVALENKGIDHQMITQILQEKKPRLLISMVSSCNKIMKENIELLLNNTTQYLEILSKKFSKKESYKKLFLDFSGTIISSSAIPGQLSYRKRNDGTFYLSAFLNALHEADEDPTWDSIFSSTMQKVNFMTNGKQSPQYELIERH